MENNKANSNELRFFWNGIKVGTGKLQKAYFSDSKLCNFPEGTITIYAKEYSGFSPEVAQQFEVENNSDMQTDYFETDTIRVTPEHPLYAQVKAALDARNAHYDKRAAQASEQPVEDDDASETYPDAAEESKRFEKATPTRLEVKFTRDDVTGRATRVSGFVYIGSATVAAHSGDRYGISFDTQANGVTFSSVGMSRDALYALRSAINEVLGEVE